MGSARRMRPKKLAEKLLLIRQRDNFSFSQMAQALSDDELKIPRTDIGRFENDTREPSLIILLRYARYAAVTADTLIDDKLELPAEFLKVK